MFHKLFFINKVTYHVWKCLLINSDQPWVETDQNIFDITMIAYDGVKNHELGIIFKLISVFLSCQIRVLEKIYIHPVVAWMWWKSFLKADAISEVLSDCTHDSNPQPLSLWTNTQPLIEIG